MFTRKLSVITLTSVCLIVLLAGNCLASHPADGQQRRNEPVLQMAYENKVEYLLGDEWNYGDIQLSCAYQPLESLTDLEWYMLWGTETSPYDEYGLGAWKEHVVFYVHRFYTEHGYIPSQLTPEVLEMSYSPHQLDPRRIDEYRNPLTGEWPRLDARDFSPGDMFIKVLAPDEERYFAQLSPAVNAYCFTHDRTDPATGERSYITPTFDGVLYIRVYGWSGVIADWLFYVYTKD